MNLPSLIKKILIRMVLITVLALGIILIPNLPVFDEKLLPEINQILTTHTNPNIAGNAYYYIYGMAAASDKDPEQVGRAVMKTLQSKHQKGEMASLTEAEAIDLYGAKENVDETWQALFSNVSCNQRIHIDCFELLQTQLNEKNFVHPRLLVQLARYQHVIKLPHMVEDMSQLDYTSPLPAFYLIMKMGEFSQARAYRESGMDGLLTSTQTDMQFWRMALTDSETLVGKMVTLACLHRNLAALSYAIKSTPQITAEQTHQLQTLLKPLTAAEISMEKKLASELRFTIENWQTAPKKNPDNESLVLRLLTQPMATTNWFYRQTLKPAFAFDKMTAIEFYEHTQTPTKALEFSRFNPYNLGGKISQSTNWQYAPYIGRAHDLAGIYSLVALQLELKANPTQDLMATIKSSPYKNPYTEKPFDYDPVNKTLGFACFDAKDICKISL